MSQGEETTIKGAGNQSKPDDKRSNENNWSLIWSELSNPTKETNKSIIEKFITFFVSISLVIYSLFDFLLLLRLSFLFVATLVDMKYGDSFQSFVRDFFITPSEFSIENEGEWLVYYDVFIHLLLKNILNFIIVLEIFETLKVPTIGKVDSGDKAQMFGKMDLRWVKIIFLVAISSTLRKIILIDYSTPILNIKNNEDKWTLITSYLVPCVLLFLLISGYGYLKFIDRKWRDDESHIIKREV